MRFLTWTEKMLIKKMMLETLERAFNKQQSNEIYLTYSEAVFGIVEITDWFQNDETILAENIVQILWALIIKAGKYRFKEQD